MNEQRSRRAGCVFRRVGAGWPSASPCRALGVALLLVALFVPPAVAGATNDVQLPSLGLMLQGRAVYQKHCLACHGAKGDGKGDMGVSVRPLPRNFRHGVFKFRSTPPGFLPTNDDLARTVRHGLTGTAMPTFNLLREHEVRAVVEYVKSFSPRWDKPENYAAPVPIPEPPAWMTNTPARAVHVARGRALFATTCGPCHGSSGAGDGPSASLLKDFEEQPIVPSDLRKPWRCGEEPRDLFRLLVTGIDGTPMPSFFPGLSAEQVWQLAAYTMELRRAASAEK